MNGQAGDRNLDFDLRRLDAYLKEWLGDEFDPASFDLEETNARLRRMKA